MSDIDQLRATAQYEQCGVADEIERLTAEVARLRGFLGLVYGNEAPCRDDVQLRRWAYEALAGRTLPA